MFRYLKLYGLLWMQNLQTNMEYTFDFLIGNLAVVIGQIVGIAFVWVIFQRIGDLNGWSLPEIMFMYGLAALPFGVCELLFNGLWKLTRFIRMGEFDRLLVRPVGPLFFILSEEFFSIFSTLAEPHIAVIQPCTAFIYNFTTNSHIKQVTFIADSGIEHYIKFSISKRRSDFILHYSCSDS